MKESREGMSREGMSRDSEDSSLLSVLDALEEHLESDDSNHSMPDLVPLVKW